MDFFSIYKSLPNRKSKKDFRTKILSGCQVEFSTFYGWLSSRRIPAPTQIIISQLLDKERKELFPDNDSN